MQDLDERWDQETFDGWHGYDADFSFRAHLAGFRLGVACDIAISHASVGHVGQDWMKYAERFSQKHKAVLPTYRPREFVVTQVRTRSRAEALEVMTPAWWEPDDPVTR